MLFRIRRSYVAVGLALAVAVAMTTLGVSSMASSTSESQPGRGRECLDLMESIAGGNAPSSVAARYGVGEQMRIETDRAIGNKFLCTGFLHPDGGFQFVGIGFIAADDSVAWLRVVDDDLGREYDWHHYLKSAGFPHVLESDGGFIASSISLEDAMRSATTKAGEVDLWAEYANAVTATEG
jgi:hypothetical protein